MYAEFRSLLDICIYIYSLFSGAIPYIHECVVYLVCIYVYVLHAAVSKQIDRWNSVWKNTQNATQATSQRHPGYIFGSVVFTHKLHNIHAFFEYDN